MTFKWIVQKNPIRLECRWRGLHAVVESVADRFASPDYTNRVWSVHRGGVLLGSSTAIRSKSAQRAAEAFMREHYGSDGAPTIMTAGVASIAS